MMMNSKNCCMHLSWIISLTSPTRWSSLIQV